VTKLVRHISRRQRREGLELQVGSKLPGRNGNLEGRNHLSGRWSQGSSAVAGEGRLQAEPSGGL